MPFIRGATTVSPTDGVTPGYWIQLSTDPPGTWSGFAQSQWPAVAGGETLASYATKLQNLYAQFTVKTIGVILTTIVVLVFQVVSLSPLTIGDITATEIGADMKVVPVH